MNPTHVRVTKLLLHETGTYNQQFRRSYETTITGQTLNVVSERLHGTNSQNRLFTPGVFAGIANQIVSPSATPEAQIEIPMGWGERRLRFLMEVEITRGTGGSVLELIQGYTNGYGISGAGHIAPDMEFIINTTTMVNQKQQMTPMGLLTVDRVADSSHILQKDNFSSFYVKDREQRMRPEDIFSVMARPMDFELNGGVDGNSAHTNIACKSSRTHGLATAYATSIASAYKHAALNNSLGQSDDDFYHNARAYSQDGLVSQDTFISLITQLRDGRHGRTFTYGDLVRMDNNVVAVTHAVLSGPTNPNTQHQHGQTSDWSAPDRTTQVATILSQSIPALAMEYAITGINFTSTNNHISGKPFTTVMNVQGFSQMDLSANVQMFIDRVEMEIISSISFNNQISYALQMHVDLLGETWISLSLDGQAPIDYVTPSFADALIVPVITNQSNRIESIGNDFQNMLSTVLNTGVDMVGGISNMNHI